MNSYGIAYEIQIWYAAFSLWFCYNLFAEANFIAVENAFSKM